MASLYFPGVHSKSQVYYEKSLKTNESAEMLV